MPESQPLLTSQQNTMNCRLGGMTSLHQMGKLGAWVGNSMIGPTRGLAEAPTLSSLSVKQHLPRSPWVHWNQRKPKSCAVHIPSKGHLFTSWVCKLDDRKSVQLHRVAPHCLEFSCGQNISLQGKGLFVKIDFPEEIATLLIKKKMPWPFYSVLTLSIPFWLIQFSCYFWEGGLAILPMLISYCLGWSSPPVSASRAVGLQSVYCAHLN